MATVELTDEAIDEIAAQISNWGRWGDDDHRGTVNLITDRVRVSASRLVESGEIVSLARPIRLGTDPRTPNSVHAVWRTSTTPAETSSEFIGMQFHGPSITHIDSLNHVHRDGRMYNGWDAAAFTPNGGYDSLTVNKIGSRVVGRGVLVDLSRHRPAEGVGGGRTLYSGDDLDRVMEAQGVRPRPGDIVFLRFGESPYEHRSETPGLDASAARWLRLHDVGVLGSDGPTDAMPPREGRWRVPIHQLAIYQLGLPLLDNCALDELSVTCERYGRYEFFVSAPALPIEGATGSPVNPIAVF